MALNYKNQLFKEVHQAASTMLKEGKIGKDEMEKYDQLCLVKTTFCEYLDKELTNEQLAQLWDKLPVEAFKQIISRLH
jgi:DNA-binding transcriptional regulator YiaG